MLSGMEIFLTIFLAFHYQEEVWLGSQRLVFRFVSRPIIQLKVHSIMTRHVLPTLPFKGLWSHLI